MEEEQAAILPEDCSLTDWAKAQAKRIAELEKALKQIGNVLGPGTCAACQCEGCAWEAKEAVRLAIDALKEAERG